MSTIYLIVSSSSFNTDTSFLSIVWSYLTNHAGDAIASLFALIVGSFITYFAQKRFRNREIKITALNNAHYIALLLCQKRASLHQIQQFLEDRRKMIPHQKQFIFPISLDIKQESIEKILAYPVFFKYDYAHFIQSLTAAEESYRICYKLIEKYNNILQKILELGENDASPLKKGYLIEINNDAHNIGIKYAEAVQLNEQTKERLDELCRQVFKKKYCILKPEELVNATELLKKRM